MTTTSRTRNRRHLEEERYVDGDNNTGEAAVGAGGRREEFRLPTNFFYDEKCEPCILREDYLIRVLAIDDGTDSNIGDGGGGNGDDRKHSSTQWYQIQAAMEQASRDTHVAIEFEVYGNTNDDYERMANSIRTLEDLKEQQQQQQQTEEYFGGSSRSSSGSGSSSSSSSTNKVPDALIVTLPPSTSVLNSQYQNMNSIVVDDAIILGLDAGIPIFGFGNNGYQRFDDLGMLEFITQNDYVAGQMVVQEILQYHLANITNSTISFNDDDNEEEEQDDTEDIIQVLFVYDDKSGEKANKNQVLFVGNTADAATAVTKSNNNSITKEGLDEDASSTQYQQAQNNYIVIEERLLGIQTEFDDYSNFNDGTYYFENATTSASAAENTTSSTTTTTTTNRRRPTFEVSSASINVPPSWSTDICTKHIIIINDGDDETTVQKIVNAVEKCSTQQQQQQAQEEEDQQTTTTLILNITGSMTVTVNIPSTPTSSSLTSNYVPPVIATFGGNYSPLVRQKMLEGTINFAAVPQVYLQSTMIVIMASIYVVSGKKLSLPVATNNLYLSGPKIVKPGTRNKLPEDAVMNCEYYGFPICESSKNDDDDYDAADDKSTTTSTTTDLSFLQPYMSDILQTLPEELVDSNRVCNAQGCLNRADIRLGGVLHGTTTCK